MREPRHPEFRFPPRERRDPERDGAMITALMWGCLVVILVAIAEIVMLRWWP